MQWPHHREPIPATTKLQLGAAVFSPLRLIPTWFITLGNIIRTSWDSGAPLLTSQALPGELTATDHTSKQVQLLASAGTTHTHGKDQGPHDGETMSTRPPLKRAQTSRPSDIKKIAVTAESASVAVVKKSSSHLTATADDSVAELDGYERRAHHALAKGDVYGDMIETKSVEDLCIRLQLTKADVWKLRKQFNDQDVDHSGLITQAEFFHLVRETRRPLTKLIFRLAHVPAAKTRITFDEYVSCACQFAALSDTELLRFLFDSYNASSGGAGLTEKDIGKLAQDFQSMDASYANNITVATQRMVQSRDQMARDGVLPFEDFERMVRANKLAFMPFLQLQRNVRQGTLGEAFWVEKLRCQVILDRLLLFMRKHHGQLPPLPWRDSLARFFLRRETANTKLFALARTMYDSVGTT